MTAIAFIADVHIANHRKLGGPIKAGINTRCGQVVKALHRAVETANAEGAEDLVVLGDLFDTTKPSPQIVAAVQSAFEKFNGEVHCLVGNHDQQTYAEGDHAMASLAPVSCIIDRPQVIDRGHYALVHIPYQPGFAPDWLPEVLEGMKDLSIDKDCPRILTLHLGIYDATWRPFWSKNSHDAVSVELLEELMAKYEIDSVFAGNWHTRRTWKSSTVVQVGSLTPTGWDDSGLKGHGVTIWKGGKYKHVEVDGPRFVNLPQSHHPDSNKTIKSILNASTDMDIYVRATADSPDMLSATYAEVESLYAFAGVDVRVDTTLARAEARNASITARSADTLDAALDGYVKAMPLPDGVDRSKVLALSKNYLAGAE